MMAHTIMTNSEQVGRNFCCICMWTVHAQGAGLNLWPFLLPQNGAVLETS